METRMQKLAITDDYHGLAMRLANWSVLRDRCAITVFDRPLAVPDEAAEVLEGFDILCTMRERMALPRALLERLPRLRLVAITGNVHRSLDLAAAAERGITVCHTDTVTGGTPELAWGLIIALARHIPSETQSMRNGGWQNTIGRMLAGRTLGLLGLGRQGSAMARIGLAFGMRVLAWSPNMTDAQAAAHGAERVEKDNLFRASDVVSIHLVLGDRSRGLVGAREFGLMRPTALLINTARGPIVDENALIDALRRRRIAGAGLDVFDHEPLPDDHPLRRLDNALLTPHLGYYTEEAIGRFYQQSIENIEAFLDGSPIRVLRAGNAP
jgi:D-3-phosphoglycerate dehydrogenase